MVLQVFQVFLVSLVVQVKHVICQLENKRQLVEQLLMLVWCLKIIKFGQFILIVSKLLHQNLSFFE